MSRRFVVIYGRKQPDAGVLQRLARHRDGEDSAGMREFAESETPALRLGDDDRVRYPPSVLAELPATADKLARLKADVARDLDVFARNPRRLLDLYFDFIATRIAAETSALENKLRPLGGLFRVEDWAFSALKPMPNAAVFDADDRDHLPPVLVHDLAFWTGRTLLTIRLRGSGTPSAREAEASDRLRAIGAEIVSIPVPELAQGIAIFADARFPAEFRSFWDGARYPCSPFRPQGLPASLALD